MRLVVRTIIYDDDVPKFMTRIRIEKEAYNVHVNNLHKYVTVQFMGRERGRVSSWNT